MGKILSIWGKILSILWEICYLIGIFRSHSPPSPTTILDSFSGKCFWQRGHNPKQSGKFPSAPLMDGKVKTLVENCVACQAVGPSNSLERMRITSRATEPWQNLVIDFDGPIPHSGQYILVVTDTYSKFSEVEIVTSTWAKGCIPKLDCIFTTHGIQKMIKTDNGPPFDGKTVCTSVVVPMWKCCAEWLNYYLKK
jgi:hypothetical protein